MNLEEIKCPSAISTNKPCLKVAWFGSGGLNNSLGDLGFWLSKGNLKALSHSIFFSCTEDVSCLRGFDFMCFNFHINCSLVHPLVGCPGDWKGHPRFAPQHVSHTCGKPLWANISHVPSACAMYFCTVLLTWAFIWVVASSLWRMRASRSLDVDFEVL